jgi:hypothetical protein
MNKIFFGAVATVIIAALGSIHLETFAQPATNMTGGLESRLQAATPEGVEKQIMPGERLFVMVCKPPPALLDDPETCQFFQARPLP